MKKLTWKIVIPLAMILFSTTKMWTYVLLEGGGSEFFRGFPLPYICPCWHTSLCFQIFIKELLIDILFYLIISFLIVYITNRWLWKIKIRRKVVIILYIISIFINANPLIILGLNDHVYKIKNDYTFKTLERGHVFSSKKPSLDKYVLIQNDYIKRLDNSWDSLINRKGVKIKFIKQVSDSFLQFSPTKRIEEVYFIDSVVVLNEMESDRLFQVISDSLSFDKNKCGLDRYFVHSGFIISSNDTLYGAIHMTYDMDCIEFTPDLNLSTSWIFSEKGKEVMIDLIDKIDKQRTPNILYK